MSRTAVYSTMYPGMEPYCADWAQSLDRQTDRNFDLWIGIDQLSIADIENAAQQKLAAEYIFAEKGDTPAQIRNRALEQLVNHYDAIIFVDSDDILLPARVESAKEFLIRYDVVGTAMHLVNQSGTPLNITFIPADALDFGDNLFRWNIFGLSNTAYRTDTLKKCLPLPADCIAVDWLLATRAYVKGARLGFDPVPQMYYRQHGTNTARIIPPFTSEQVFSATRIVMHHQSIMNDCTINDQQKRLLLQEHQKVKKFFNNLSTSSAMLDKYILALNKLPIQCVWWACVAHPDLEDIWNH